MTLSEVSYYTRKFGPIASIGFVLFLIFFGIISMLLGQATSQTAAPKAYEPPFGLLRPIQFSHHIDYPPNVTFKIDNIEGRPLKLASVANVYFIPPSRTRFGYQQSVALMAKAAGIDTETNNYELVDTTATYKDELRTLAIDITNFNFTFEMDYKKVPTLFSDTYAPSETKVKEDAKAFLRQMNKFTPGLAQGSQNIIYRKYDPATDTFAVVETPDQANVVEVDFFGPAIQSLPVVSPKFYNSHTYVTMVFHQEGVVYIKAQVKDFPHDITHPGNYPLKSGDRAWAELINKEGTIVSPSQGSTDIVVRDMFLAYYAAETYQPYILPVFVFIGDNGFAAYVSAIDNAYIQK